MTAFAAGPYGATQCAASRFGSNLGCTANDVSINTITVASGSPTSCVGGATLPLNLNVTVNFGSATRYDIGVFVSNDGKSPQFLPSTGASSCSVAVLPTTSPFFGSVASGGDGDTCGDGNSGINGGTGQGTFAMSGVAVPCTTDGSGNTTLSIPYVVSWDQSSGNFCADNTYPVPGTTSKCNSGTVTFPVGTSIIVLPAITITDGVTTVRSGGTVTYTVVITNSTASPLSGAVFTDPAVANLSVSGVSCVAAGGATCPSSPTVSAMQGTGITLPTMPNNSTLTFTVTGTVATVASPTSLTNTANVTVSTATNSASDTDTILAVPSATKSFSSSTIGVNGVSTLTVTLTNPDAVAITGVAFTDTYPTNMLTAASPALSNGCGGTATAAANGSSLVLTGGTIAANNSCSITVAVTATAAGSYTNSTGAISTTNAGTGTAGSGTLTVLSPPTVTKSFDATTIPINGTTVLNITLSNPNATAITGVAFTDTYPSTNLKNAATPGLSNGCLGTATGTANASALSLTGGTIPANSSCTVRVTVTGTASGSYLNSTGSIASTNAGSGTAATATLNVLAAPTVTKSFNLSTIAVNGNSTLTITLTNPNSTAITGVAFTDTYPSNMQNAATPALSNGCLGTATGAAGGTSLSLSGGTIPANSNCIVSVNVTATASGSYLNSTGVITSGNAGNGTASTATLTVLGVPTVVKSFGATTIPINGTTTLTILLSNPNATAITGVAFTDTYPANMLNAGTPSLNNSCGGTATGAAAASVLSLTGATIPANGSCQVQVSVTATASGSYTNSSGPIATGNAGTGTANSATLTVLGSPTVAKSFGAATIPINGTTTLTITLTNPNATAVTGVAFTDTYPSTNLKNATTPGLSNGCGGTATGTANASVLSLSGATIPANSSCTVSVTVTATASGSYINSTGSISSSNAGSGTATTATLIVLGAPTVTKSFNASTIAVNGSSTLTITLTNPNGSTAITGVAFTDTYPSTNLKNAGTPGLTNTCTGTATAVVAASSLSLSGGTIAAGGTCTLTVSVTSSVAASYANTIAIGAVSSTNAGSNSAAANATLIVSIIPSATMSFNPVSIGVNGTSQLTVTLTNPTGTAVTASFTSNSYPLNMANTGSPAAATTCSGGTASALAGGTSFGLAGATIPANGSCTVTLNVTATVAASYLVSTGTITSNATTGNIAAASGTLIVLSPLTMSKGFGTTSILVNGTSTLTITLTNPNAAAVTGLDFTDNYPSTSLKNTAAPVLFGCTGTLKGVAGDSFVGVTGWSIPGGGTCTITVTVTATASGSYINSISVGTTNAGSAGPATATLTVSAVSNFNAFETSTTANAITGKIFTKLAGTSFSLDVVAIGNGVQASSFNDSVQLELLANTGTAGIGYGTDNCPTSSSVIQTVAASYTLSGGRSPLNSPAIFAAVAGAYRDVRVRITYSGTTPSVVACSSDSFAIRPSAVTLMTSAIAASPSASAIPITKAGAPFTFYATTNTNNYSGTLTQDPTKLSAQITTQDTSRAAGGVVGTLSPAVLTANLIPASANASYSEVGYLYMGPGAYRDDTFTSVDQSGDCIADTAADANSDNILDYLSDTLVGGQYGCSIGNNAPLSTALSLGRFIPDHFGVTGEVQTRSDLLTSPSTFTYMDEPMKLTLAVTAYSAADTQTKNYTGVFAKLSATGINGGTNWFNTGCASDTQCIGLGAVSGTTGLTTRLVIDTTNPNSVAPTNTTWAMGASSFALFVNFARLAAGPDGPYNALQFGAMPHDTDGVTVPAYTSTDTGHRVDLDATNGTTVASNFDRRLLFSTKVRFGRLRLFNTWGSDLRNMTIPIKAQYWNGQTWVQNNDDSLTTIPVGSIALSNQAGKLTASNMAMPGNVSSVGTLATGSGSIVLLCPYGDCSSLTGKPSSRLTGSVDVAINLGLNPGSVTQDQSCLFGSHPNTTGAALPWLRSRNGSCMTSFDRDPSGRMSFGIAAPETNRSVHIRELF